jgi:hypothetical protein
LTVTRLLKQIEMTKEKTRVPLHYKVIFVWFMVLFIGITVTNLTADTLTHKFKNPSFSGQNTIIEYSIADGMITLRIVDEYGNETIIELPIGDFTF